MLYVRDPDTVLPWISESDEARVLEREVPPGWDVLAISTGVGLV
jgi:hypothetical protein